MRKKTIRDRAKRGEIVSQKKMRRDTMLEKTIRDRAKRGEIEAGLQGR